MYMYKKTGLTIIFVGTYLVAKHNQEKERKKKKGKTKQKRQDKADVPRQVYIHIYLQYLRQATSRPDFHHLYLPRYGTVRYITLVILSVY